MSEELTAIGRKRVCRHLVGDLAYSHGKPNDYCPLCGAKITNKLKKEFIEDWKRLNPLNP